MKQIINLKELHKKLQLTDEQKELLSDAALEYSNYFHSRAVILESMGYEKKSFNKHVTGDIVANFYKIINCIDDDYNHDNLEELMNSVVICENCKCFQWNQWDISAKCKSCGSTSLVQTHYSNAKKIEK